MSESTKNTPEAADIIDLPVEQTLRGVFVGPPGELPPQENAPDEKRAALSFYDLDEGRMKVVSGGFEWFWQVLSFKSSHPLGQWSFELTPTDTDGSPGTRVSPAAELSNDEAARIQGLAPFDLD